MPKIIKDPNEKCISCNVSLPLGYVSCIDEFVEQLRGCYGEALPKNFGRSDLVRILVDRYFVRPVRDRKGKKFSMSKNDDDFCQIAFDVCQEYGIQESEQIDIDFDTIEESTN